MSENKSNKKLIIILLAIALLVAGLFIIKPWNKKPIIDNEETPCENCAVEKDENDPFNLTYSGETVKYNAYDFIIEKMSQAQYWTYDQYHPKYNCDYEEHNYDDNIINGSGWILYDEDSASFVRGYESRLIINFSNHTAESDDKFADGYQRYEGNLAGKNTIDIINDEPYNGEQIFIDYANHTIKSHDVNFEDGSFDSEWDFDGQIITREGNAIPGNYTTEILHTFEFYENVFSKLGIPLLNQPAGTLASYKNKTIEVPVELVDLKYWDRFNDDKIHTIFDERVGWNWYWERNEEIEWLDDYREIMDKKFPDSTENELKSFYFVDLDQDKTYNYYAPLFLCIADRQEHTSDNGRYKFTGTHSEEYIDSKINGVNSAMDELITTYWLKPLYEHIFGFNGVYYVDSYKLENNPYDVNQSRTYEQFEKGIKSDGVGNIVAVFNKGDFTTDSSYSLDTNWSNGLLYYMNEICKHYNVESPYGNDYVYNIYLINSKNEQERLGLR